MERPDELLSLNASDICKIIKQCSSCGVTEFSYQSLTITFEAKEEIEPEEITPSSKVIEEAQEPINLTEVEKKAIREQELIQKELELSTMELEDPYEFENLMATGALEATVDQIVEEENED